MLPLLKRRRSKTRKLARVGRWLGVRWTGRSEARSSNGSEVCSVAGTPGRLSIRRPRFTWHKSSNYALALSLARLARAKTPPKAARGINLINLFAELSNSGIHDRLVYETVKNTAQQLQTEDRL